MGYFSAVLAEPAAQTAAQAVDPRNLKRVSLKDIAALNVIGQDLWNPFFAAKGFTGTQDGYGGGFAGNWATDFGVSESGSPVWTSIPNDDALKAFDGYTFDWTQGDRRAGTLVGYDPQGNQIGSWNQAPEQSTLSSMGEWLALAGAGFGGLGLAGLGPLGGALGGAGGAGQVGSSVAGAGGEAAANLAAYGGSLTPAQVAGTAAFDIGAAGAAAGAGGFSSLLSSLGTLGGIKDLASIASGIYGVSLANKAREASDPFAPYRGAYGAQLAALEANPGSIVSRPGFQAGLETIERKSAATGFYGSGNMASALGRYSGDFYNQEAARLASLAGAGQTPGAGQFNAADLASKSLGSIGYGLAPMLERFIRGG